MYEINILKSTANFSLYVGHIALVVVMWNCEHEFSNVNVTYMVAICKAYT